MSAIGCNFGKLKKTHPGEYVSRFLFGAAVTLIAALIGKWLGPIVGGLFLAFPGIFPPGMSFVERLEQEEKQQHGVHGQQRARALASVHAAGASAGTFGLIAFALIVWLGLGHFRPVVTMLTATLSWFAVSYAAWWIREKL